MKKNQLLATTKTGLLVLTGGAFLLTSCASDGFEDESFDTGVRNVQVEALAEDQISINPSADESKTIIEWKVINGASGYECKVYNTTTGTNVLLLDSLVDGRQIIVNREEDNNYLFTILPKGDQGRGNSDAAQMTSMAFNSFSETFATIPDNTDLFSYFQTNPVPAESAGKELCFDLKPGGTYTLTGNVNFGLQRVAIRSTSQNNPASITMSSGSTFIAGNGISLKYLQIDASAADKPVITMTDSPDDSFKSNKKDGWYEIESPVSIKNCTITSLGTSIVATNSIKYLIYNLVVNNSLIEMDATTTGANANAIVYLKSGYAKETQLKNSTIYSKAKIEKFLLNFGNRPKDVSETETRDVIIENCTLANIANGKNLCNYHNGQKTYSYTLINSITIDCGKGGQVVQGMNQGQDSENPTWNINNNTFWRNGVVDTQTGSKWTTNNKGSNTVITTDPGIDPTTGNFTPAAEQQAAKQGDPRWFTAQ